MKKFAVVVGVLVAGAACAQAAEKGGGKDDGGLGVMATYWTPKDFSEQVGFGAKLRIGGKALALEARASYFDSMTATNAGTGGLDLQVIPLDLGLTLRAHKNETFVPYLGAGGSYYLLTDNSSSGSVEVDDEIGWYGVAGCEIMLGDGASIFAEAMYRNVSGTAFNDNLQNVEEGADIDFSGLAVNAGLMIRF